MTPEQLDLDLAKAIAAKIINDDAFSGATMVAAIESVLQERGIVPPPDPISPRVMAAREWLRRHGCYPSEEIDSGGHDQAYEIPAFLAGFAAAVKLAGPVVEACVALTAPGGIYRFPRIVSACQAYRQSIGDE